MEIEVGDKFFVPNDGTIFIVDKIEIHEKWGALVCSSLEGGAKGNYRDSLEDFIEFLKENSATKII
jgi:hypothetical protein